MHTARSEVLFSIPLPGRPTVTTSGVVQLSLWCFSKKSVFIFDFTGVARYAVRNRGTKCTCLLRWRRDIVVATTGWPHCGNEGRGSNWALGSRTAHCNLSYSRHMHKPYHCRHGPRRTTTCMNHTRNITVLLT